MTVSDTSTPRRRRLDREEVLVLAERIASTEGPQALTLRRIGAELGVHHTALYRTFRDKDEMLQAVADRVLERRAPVREGASWRERLRSRADFALERYRVHPDLAELIAMQSAATPALLEMAESNLDCLVELGLTIDEAGRFTQLMESFVVGFGLYASVIREAERSDSTTDAEAERRAISSLPPDKFPRLVAAAPTLPLDPDQVFAIGIELFLDAIETATANVGEQKGTR